MLIWKPPAKRTSARLRSCSCFASSSAMPISKSAIPSSGTIEGRRMTDLVLRVWYQKRVEEEVRHGGMMKW